MRIVKPAISAGMLLALCSITTSVAAETFTIHFPPPSTNPAAAAWGLNASPGHGAGTSGSFAAAAMMGAKGWNNYVPPSSWENLIMEGVFNVSQGCRWHTTAVQGTSIWPSGCNPAGMVRNLSLPPFTPASWALVSLAGPIDPTTREVDESLPDPNKPLAMDNVVNALKFHRSPAVIPMYGQADHWVTITEISATSLNGHWRIDLVKYFDGGPTGGFSDESGQSYQTQAGIFSMNGTVFRGGWYSVITGINTSVCNPCVNDPYYGHYVLLYEPPAGQTFPPPAPTLTAKAPGIGRVNERLAQQFVWKALALAGVDQDPQMWSAIAGGFAGPASLVNALFPSGEPWNYYLVPILSNTNTSLVIAFVQLAADDGSFQSMHLLPSPLPFVPMDVTRARNRASAMLGKDERLQNARLTWDPRKDISMNRIPTSPYYEFDVVDDSKPTGNAGRVRVQFRDGVSLRQR